MVRTVIIPTDTEVHLSIAKEYVGKPIEITYLALEELESKTKHKTIADFWGVISDKTAKALHEQVEKNC